MSYSTRKELKTLFPKLDEFNMDAAGVTAFISRADNMINGKLAERYTVPFSGTPPIINDVSKNLSMFYILQRHYTQQIPNQSDWVTSWKNEAFETLDGLADGSISLTNSSGAIIEQRTDRQQLLSTTKNWKPVFDMRDEVCQHIDPDRLDAENAEDS